MRTPNLITESVIVLCCVHGEMYLKNTKMQRHFIHGNITTPSQILWWKQHLVTDSVKFHRICDGIVLFPCMKFNKILLWTYHYNITESVKYHRFCDCLDLFSLYDLSLIPPWTQHCAITDSVIKFLNFWILIRYINYNSTFILPLPFSIF